MGCLGKIIKLFLIITILYFLYITYKNSTNNNTNFFYQLGYEAKNIISNISEGFNKE